MHHETAEGGPSAEFSPEFEADRMSLGLRRRPGAFALRPSGRRSVGGGHERAQTDGVALSLGECAQGGPAVSAEGNQHPPFRGDARGGLRVVQGG
jgi:hypothetical protein